MVKSCLFASNDVGKIDLASVIQMLGRVFDLSSNTVYRLINKPVSENKKFNRVILYFEHLGKKACRNLR